MPSALIGHTGFVGSNLARQMDFDALYNSRNIDEMRGKAFDLVVCAGVYGSKWRANERPSDDWSAIFRLIDALRDVHAERFVLISTVDVFADPREVDERNRPTTRRLHWYGINRLVLELVTEPTLTIRLPAIFGSGLKKNALYDLIHNRAERVPANAVYQWYPLHRLGSVIESALNRQIRLLHLTSTPIGMMTLQKRFFPDHALGAPIKGAPTYDVRSVYSDFRLTQADMLIEMEAYLGNEGSLQQRG